MKIDLWMTFKTFLTTTVKKNIPTSMQKCEVASFPAMAECPPEKDAEMQEKTVPACKGF